jgi:hypothetical protein
VRETTQTVKTLARNEAAVMDAISRLAHIANIHE